MYKKVDLIRASIEMMRLAETDTEKLVLSLEILEMQAELLVSLDDVAKDMQEMLHNVVSLHVPASILKNNLMNFDYMMHVDAQ